MQTRLNAAPIDPVSLLEERFILETAFKHQLRVDGRRLDEARDCEVSVATVNGTTSLAHCSLGNETKVSCLVSAELAVPYVDRPREGMISINTDFMHSAGPGIVTIPDLQLLERTVLKAVDVESLCIVPGAKAWSVKCYLTVLANQGAVIDACTIAALTALLHFRRPDVLVVGDEITVYSVRERIPVPLSIHHVPICVSFSLLDVLHLHKEGDADLGKPDCIPLMDPTHREELVAKSASFRVLLNSHQEICGASQFGAWVDRAMLKEMVKVAMPVRDARQRVLQAALAESPFL